MEGKSVLDGIPVVENEVVRGNCSPTQPKHQEIVGHCPTCGCPVYGQKKVTQGEDVEVRRSCNCWRRPSGGIEQVMETK